jgi:CheY-like chemotaxis protein
VEELRGAGLEPEWRQADDGLPLSRMFLEQRPDVVLIAHRLSEDKPQFLLKDVLMAAAEQGPDIPVWMFIKPQDEAEAVAMMPLGVGDYFFTDRLSRLGPMAVSLSRQRKSIFELVDLNQIVDESKTTYDSLIVSRGLETTFLPGVDLPAVWGDPKLLAQVVSSLLVNAIQYTPGGGKIAIQTYLYAVRSEVCLIIKDTGIGINRKDKHHVFDRFFRGEQALQRHVFGIGLGLATAKDIVEMHDGRIEVESEVGEGAVFTIYLPAVLDKLSPDQQRLLIVENSQLMRSILQEALEQEGFIVQTAENGAEALAKLDDFQPDLILSDVVMPQMDGFAFFDAVRSRPDWAAIPFIFVTGQSEQKDFLDELSLRGASYLIKPIIIEELLVAVRSRLM